MTKFIKVQDVHGADVYLNPDNVVFVSRNKEQIIGVSVLALINGLALEIKGSPAFNAELLSGETEPLT
jgi:hypothetical protein